MEHKEIKPTRDILKINKNFLQDYDLAYYIMDYAKPYFIENEPHGQEYFEQWCYDGIFSLGELYQASFEVACKKNDAESLSYFLEVYPHGYDLKYNNYGVFSTVLDKNSTECLVLLCHYIHVDKEFVDFYDKYKSNPYAKINESTALMDKIIFQYHLNENLDNSIAQNKNKI